MTTATAATTALSAQDGFTVASVEGEIDISNSSELEAELSHAVRNDARGLALDLSGVTFIDSSGIRTLFALAARLGGHQQLLHLVLPEGSPLRRTLGMLQIPAVAPVFDDLAAATSTR
jgi:anti-anti-sigma factor